MKSHPTFFTAGNWIIAATLLGLGSVYLFREQVFSANFLPHSTCYLQNPQLIWSNAISDTLIGGAYVSISSTLAFLVYRASKDIPFHWVFLAFGLFIVSCGFTHFMEVLTVWKPYYWLAALVKCVTAGASVATAIALFPLVPKIFGLLADVKASAQKKEELEQSGRQIRELNATLERRVRERTEELEKTVASLRQSERQLRDALAVAEAATHKAEQATKAKDQFIAVLSHELRTPLMPVLMTVSALQQAENIPGPVRRGLTLIARNVEREKQLIDDLLDWNRFTYQKTEHLPEVVNIHDCVHKSLELAEEDFRKSGIRLELHLEAESPWVRADPNRLQQVFWNLLKNATKFNRDQGWVEVRTRNIPEGIRVTIRDPGIGIQQDRLDKIFEAFEQESPDVALTHGGLGLGLAISKTIVESHHGRIWAESAGKDRGTTFVVELPAAAAESREHQPGQEEA